MVVFFDNCRTLRSSFRNFLVYFLSSFGVTQFPTQPTAEISFFFFFVSSPPNSFDVIKVTKMRGSHFIIVSCITFFAVIHNCV